MMRQNIRATMGLGLGVLAFVLASAQAFAQSSYYSSARKLDDNGSVSEPSPTGANANAMVRQPVRAPLVNQAPTQQHQYYSSARHADDNGSVDEPGPSH
jgi:hypothetical protein